MAVGETATGRSAGSDPFKLFGVSPSSNQRTAMRPQPRQGTPQTNSPESATFLLW